MLSSDSSILTPTVHYSLRAKSIHENGETGGYQSAKQFWVSQIDFQIYPQNGPQTGPVFYFEL